MLFMDTSPGFGPTLGEKGRMPRQGARTVCSIQNVSYVGTRGTEGRWLGLPGNLAP